MNQELKDFKCFEKNKLHRVDFQRGVIDTKHKIGGFISMDVGSENDDGYVRVVCSENRQRMKHRLLYYLYHGELPGKGYEIDHFNSIRNNNEISNLRILSKSKNNRRVNNASCGNRFPNETIFLACRMLSETTLSDNDIAIETGLSRSYVRDLKTRRRRTRLTKSYSWEHRGY